MKMIRIFEIFCFQFENTSFHYTFVWFTRSVMKLLETAINKKKNTWTILKTTILYIKNVYNQIKVGIANI